MTTAKDDFPYKRLCSDMAAQIRVRFTNLIEYRPTFRKMIYNINNAPDFRTQNLRFCFAGSMDPLIMVLDARDYEKYNLISDYFIEQYRIRAYRSDDPARESVYDYWNKHRDELSDNDCARSREAIYRAKMEVGTFRPTVATGLVWLMRAHLGTPCEWVLNPCAGWGDRLIGFAAAGIKGLVDVDPNVQLGAQYAQIRDWTRTLMPQDRALQYTYIPRPFEDISCDELLAIPGRGYDLVLMDPPYFDLEVYVRDDTEHTQSISRYTTFEDWYNKFLIACARKCGECLRIGGLFALIINQAPSARADPRMRFLHRMVSDITRTTSVRLRYLGVISYAEVRDGARIRSPQPMWMWSRERA
jgi:hypothetical protein